MNATTLELQTFLLDRQGEVKINFIIIFIKFDFQFAFMEINMVQKIDFKIMKTNE